jgi:hypothetical protein
MTIDAQTPLMAIIVGDAAACVVALSDRTSAIGFLIASIVGAYASVFTTRP